VLCALMHLKILSISSQITGNNWALPEIIQIVNSAPAVPDVVLWFYCHDSNISFLAQLDWSFTGKRPRINLFVTSEDRKHEDILDALAANEALMDLVKCGLVVLRSEGISLWGIEQVPWSPQPLPQSVYRSLYSLVFDF